MSQALPTPEQLNLHNQLKPDSLGRKPQEPAILGDLMLATRVTGYIGKDGYYQFGKRIRLENGEPLSVSPKDFYLRTVIRTEGSTDFRDFELPSSLFKSSCQASMIRFYYDHNLYQLNLVPTSIRPTSKEEECEFVPFEKALKAVEANLLYTKNEGVEFLKLQDIPDDYFCWDDQCHYILSPQAKRVKLGEIGATALEANSLKCISSALPGINGDHLLNENGLIFIYEAAGNPQITIVIDRGHLYIHTQRKRPRIEGEVDARYQIPLERFYHGFFGTFPIDETTISAKLDHAGYLTLNLPFQPNLSDENRRAISCAIEESQRLSLGPQSPQKLEVSA